LGGGDRYASASGDPLLEPWRTAVEQSDAVRQLKRLVAEVQQLRPIDDAAAERTVRAILSPEELWARSYAQYIAIQSGDPRLIAALQVARTPPPKTEYYPTQWGDVDFVPIGVAIEQLLRRVGWRTETTG
jgi:hypothetical protein